MTENEAIKELKEELETVNCYRESCGLKGDNGHTLALKLAITALEEIQQYRAIGTVEEFKAMKEYN